MFIKYVTIRRLSFYVTGVLYVVGGRDSSNAPWSIVSGYQITSEGNLKYVPVAQMKSSRENPGVTATRTGLIVCGGDSGSPLKTCEDYHQKSNRCVQYIFPHCCNALM